MDDNATNRELMHQIFQIWQVDHALAESGEQALDLLQQQAQENQTPFTIAILDLQMPKMDGTQLCKRIRENPDYHDMKLVLLTSQGQRGDAKKMKALGFTGYLNKPVNQSELFNALLLVSGITDNRPGTHLITRYSSYDEDKFNAKILLVEDMETNQKIAKGMLQKLGLQVDIASNGIEAVYALKQNAFDLIFMDCQMPVMDGYEATEHIRSSRFFVKNTDIPIVAMTANAMQGDREKCLSVGMNGYISKPIDPNKLLQVLQKWLPAPCQVSSNHSLQEVKEGASSTDDEANKTIVFDYEGLCQRLMNDNDLIHSIIGTFLIDMGKQMTQLNEFLEQNLLVESTTQVHKIKGASSNIGGLAMSKKAKEMELLGEAGKLLDFQRNMGALTVEFESLKCQMMEKQP